MFFLCNNDIEHLYLILSIGNSCDTCHISINADESVLFRKQKTGDVLDILTFRE